MGSGVAGSHKITGHKVEESDTEKLDASPTQPCPPQKNKMAPWPARAAAVHHVKREDSIFWNIVYVHAVSLPRSLNTLLCSETTYILSEGFSLLASMEKEQGSGSNYELSLPLT